MKSRFFILISIITICLTSCDLSVYDLLVHKKCNEQTLSEDLDIMERRMDSTDFQKLKYGLCQIKLEGGDVNAYTYYEIKVFWEKITNGSNISSKWDGKTVLKKSLRKHDNQISINSINESLQLADSLGCENWKNGTKDQLLSYGKHTWWNLVGDKDDGISKLIELEMTNNEIIKFFDLNTFAMIRFKFIQPELVKGLSEDLNQKIDSLRLITKPKLH